MSPVHDIIVVIIDLVALKYTVVALMNYII